MLLRFKIKNFLSFYEETEFDMFPNPKRLSFTNHVYTEGHEVPLLKQAAIYGSNGSGKSNFIKALWFVKSFVTKEDFLKQLELKDFLFQLTNDKNSTVKFEIEFFENRQYFLYNVEISEQKIVESLEISGLNQKPNKRIFQRDGAEIISDYLQNTSSAQQLLSMNMQSSLLPLNRKFPVLLNDDIPLAFDWFDKQLEIITINSTIPMLIELMSNQPKLLDFANDVFENIGIGIKSVKVADTPLEKWISKNRNSKELQQLIESDPLKPNTGISRIENKRNIFSVSLKKGVETVHEFLFAQSGLGGIQKEMKITSQSDGTVRLLTLIPAIYNVINTPKVVLIDEIDNSIHPNLMFSLLKYYSEHKSKGQLIYTTHTTQLLNQQELLRPDEIWLTDKIDGSSKMYSLNDFKIHNTINLENGYLDGRYGAIPQIGDFKE
jgi:AAA15 family ATPase/GTPase